MSGTTSIDDLPLSSGGSNDPVQLQVSQQFQPQQPSQTLQSVDASLKNEKADSAVAMRKLEEERKQLDMATQGQRMTQQPHQLSQEDASSLVSGLQQASRAGVLSLPSRDIPMVNSQVNMDQEARVNYVPQHPQQPDYIGNTQTTDEIIAHSNKIKSRADTMDSIYEEIQTPLLIGIMFFVFMIPSVRAFMFKSFPMLLQNDGNPTLGGYLYIAGMFGLIYYVLSKLMHHFSQV